jgi:imidazolonepropionase-like amidohydrolase
MFSNFLEASFSSAQNSLLQKDRLQRKGSIMKNFIFAFIALIPLSMFASDQKEHTSSSTFVIESVTIVDVEKGVLQENCAVVVSGEKIRQIAQGSNADISKVPKVIDGRGLFMIPALFDAHMHYVDQTTFGPMMVANGVLFVRDMGNPTDNAIALRAKLKNGEILGPEMITTGSVLDGFPPAIPPLCISCRTPEEGREAVRKQVSAGVDQIKVYSGLQKDVFLAILDEAKRLGVKAVGHVPESIYIEEAANAGLKSSEHPFGFGKIIAKMLGDPVYLSTKGMGTDVPYFLRFKDVDKEEFRKALKRISATGMHVCPTLVVFKHGPHLKEIFSGKYPMLEYVSPMVKGMWKAMWSAQSDNEVVSKILPPMEDVVKELHENGIQLMVGTDLITPGVVAGYSVHEEMALWQDAGIPPLDILRSATIIPAKFVGVNNRLGTVAEGKTASFILLRANPLEDIRNVDKIEGVMFRGRYFGRTDLERLMEDVKRECGDQKK